MTSTRIRKSFLPISIAVSARQHNFVAAHRLFPPSKVIVNSSKRLYGNFANDLRKNTNSLFGQGVWNSRRYSAIIADSEIKSGENVKSSVFYTDSTAETLTSQLIQDKKSKHRVYENDLVKLISKTEENKFATSQQALAMLSSCSSLLPDVTPCERIKLLEKVWATLKNHLTFSVNHYNEILHCYKDNSHKFVARTFIDNMSPVKPNDVTYQLLLAAVCEVGDMNQAAEIIANMKSVKVPITETILNSLIEGHGKAGHMDGVKEVLEMMRTLKIQPTLATQTSIMKAAIWNNRIDDFQVFLTDACNKGTIFSEKQVLEIIRCLAHMNLDVHIKEVLELLPPVVLKNPEISPYMYSICVQLVHEGFPEIAYSIIKRLPPQVLGPKDDQTLYCRKFLRECLKSHVSFEVVKKISVDLIESERNTFALHVACEGAFHYRELKVGLDLLKCLHENGHPIRCHYFWPLLVQESKINGETGIFDVLSLMQTMNVLPDYETFMDYILKNLNTASPEILIQKFKSHGISLSSSLTPVVCVLLKMAKMKEAVEICEKFHGTLSCNVLIHPLIQSYMLTLDDDSLFQILEIFSKRPADTKKDWVGLFLAAFLSKLKWEVDVKNVESFLNKFSKSNVGISTSAVEMCYNNVEALKIGPEAIDRIKKTLLSMIKDQPNGELSVSSQHIPHPRDMATNQLEAHLVELESKNMNTRGVLRRLLQEYCRQGKIEDAKKIIAKCESLRIQFSAGMIANIFDLHVKCNDLQNAQTCLSILHKTKPDFTIDEFKMLSYATLLIRNKKHKQAITVLEDFAKKGNIKGGKGVEYNCWNLLDAMSKSGSVKETEKLMAFLTRAGFCQTSNVILGPLIRSYLNAFDDAGAVEKFIACSNTYRKSPLKHELLCRLLTRANEFSASQSEGSEENYEKYQKMLSQVLDADKKIHGASKSQTSFIIALADMGLKKPLRKYVLDPTVTLNQEDILNQCNRLAQENKLKAVEIIAEAMDGIRNICVEDLYEIIVKIHSFNSDCKGAEDLWNKMQEKNIKPSKKFIDVFGGLLKSHNREIPSDFITHYNAETKTNVLQN